MRRTLAAYATLLTSLIACTEQPTTAPREETLLARAAASDPTPGAITLEEIGGFPGGGLGAAEITAFDHVSRRLFVVNGALGTADVLDVKDPSNPVKVGTISVTQFGSGANSVAAENGVVALAVQAHTKTDPGTVAFYRATTLELISSVTVGALPDMVTFSPSGKELLVANEGEPNDDYTVDPEGSVSIIDVHDINHPTVRTAGLGAYIGQEASLRAAGVRIFGPGANAARDLEPEYIAVSPDGATAYVALQENNALALVNIATATVTGIVPLGYKNHLTPGQGLDPSDRDGAALIGRWPVFGMYMPDGIAAYQSGGQTYIVTANEGDARDYDGFAEEERAGDLPLSAALDARCGPPPARCSDDDKLGRLTVTTTLGLNPETGEYDELYVFGARSFSIWTPAGQRVWDSGEEFERRTMNVAQANFNASHDNNGFDNRSDNKGPEPEGITLGRLGAKTFAFIGLERIGGVMVYDVTNPFAPSFVTYANTRSGNSGDRGPEGLAFVPANRSPNQQPLLIVGNEISGTTTIFRINLQ